MVDVPSRTFALLSFARSQAERCLKLANDAADVSMKERFLKLRAEYREQADNEDSDGLMS